MSKVTPPKKTLKAKGGSGSSNMKQLSLMSFFKPAPSQAMSSSPLRAKSKHPESDKENDTSLMSVQTDTPLTSESEVAASVETKANIHSSPIKRHEPAEEAHNEQPSSKLPKLGSANRGRAKHQVSYAESDASDEEDAPVRRKRRKLIESDEEDTFEPPQDEDDEDDHMSDFVVKESDHSEHEDPADESEDELPKTKRNKPKNEKSIKQEQESKIKTESSLGSKFTANSTYVSSGPPTIAKKQSPAKPSKKSFEKENEERYQWLVNVRDAEKRTVDDPNYDSRTLYIPSSAWAKFTAFEKQYWEIKSKMWDTVVFFKKGKFYELYENDAMIANTQFDLKIAGGGRANMKLAGVPEMSFQYWAKEFISIGYKVAKVDQVESMLAKEMRGGGSKEEKIIKRELTGVLTGGTLTDMDMINDDMATYCLAIKESTTEQGQRIFGCCFVDTATSELNFIELIDDEECTKLDTLITQVKPKEVLCLKNDLCLNAVKILKYSAHNSHQIWNYLTPFTEFWDFDTTLENLVKSKYYPAADLDDYSQYPDILLKMKDEHSVAFTAFGGLLYYLKSLKLDESIMTLKNFKEYQISRSSATHMLLDGITLNNLEILNNNFDGGDKGTLLKLLNRAITPFGKREMKNWVLHPLVKQSAIESRFDAVEFLMNSEPELRVSLESSLNQLPDLERLIARVHSKTLRFKDFVKVVEGFETISKMFKTIQKYLIGSLGALSTFVSKFPEDLHSIIASWDDAFDRQEAMQNNVVPAEGVDQEFDESIGIIKSLESQLGEHLKSYKKTYKSHEICFRDSGKELYLIEMPIKIKNIPHDWQQMAATSKVKRYWSPEVKKLVRELMEQKETHKSVCETIISRIYGRFDVNYKTWVSVMKIVASIDCLISLAKTSETIGFPSCRPQLVNEQDGSIAFEELRHPCYARNTDFIPNDVHLGGDRASFGLLTGANAAGKSTLMRTTALAAILAQIGCYVPAQSARITPIDKIMTRLGANDNIIQGKSTFFVELSETKKILSNATSKSLVILDELGRGGSSSDGYAIAESVLHHLATHVQPLGFFATHYGSLGLSFTNHPRIQALRMGIVVEKTSRNITFLYKLEEGTASGSFGMNVAAMCGIAGNIIDKAETAAKSFEQTSKLKEVHDKQQASSMSLGMQSDVAWFCKAPEELEKEILRYEEHEKANALGCLFRMIDTL